MGEPRRAVVYLTWGADQEQNVLASVRGSRLPYDIYWITNVPPAGPTPEVTVLQVSYGNTNGHLPKADLGRYLPEGYDSLLYLDSDTRVLGDVSLGFELAEKVGIALVPAVKYSLSDYQKGRELMETLSIVDKGQQIYNSGVVFLRDTPDVRELLEDWAELTRRFLDVNRSDQLTLTLAMERRGIVPAPLSKNFNCRAYGERLVGDVRIWHSRRSPPADLNLHPHVDRRVVRGVVRAWNGVKVWAWPYRLRRRRQ